MPTNMTNVRGSRWVFTINNPLAADITQVADLGVVDGTKYLVVGREIGEQGTPHLQGFVIFRNARFFGAVRTILPRAHLELARGSSKQASDYCKKDGDFDEYGSLGKQGERTDLTALFAWSDQFTTDNGRPPSEEDVARAHPEALTKFTRFVHVARLRAPAPVLQEGDCRPWQAALEERLAAPATSDREVEFFVDPEGGSGKTWFMKYFFTKYPVITQMLGVGKRDDMAHALDETKSVFLINVPRGGMQYLQYTILEGIKDQVVSAPKYNSTTKILRILPHVVVFCNEHPDMDKMTADRYVLHDM